MSSWFLSLQLFRFRHQSISLFRMVNRGSSPLLRRLRFFNIRRRQVSTVFVLIPYLSAISWLVWSRASLLNPCSALIDRV